jgi:hypothetical protein
VLEILVTEEFGRISDMNGQIKLPGKIYAKASDQSAQDSLMGTMVWSHKETSCPQGLTQLYCGAIRIFSNESASFAGGVALLEEKGQVAGLELQSKNLLCHHPSYVTHLHAIAVVIHPDNFTSIATDAFDPSQVTDYIRLESELSFLHVKTTLFHRDRLCQVKLAICETRRQVASSRLKVIAASDNPYSLIKVFGRGHMAIRAGAAVYMTRCAPVSVSPRPVMNCTSEIPVHFNGTDMYVDPIRYVLRTHAVPIKCTDVMPPRFNIGCRWYCLIGQEIWLSPVIQATWEARAVG